MIESNDFERWVCIVRAGVFVLPYGTSLTITESNLAEMVASFRGPMPVDVEFRSFASHDLPLPHGGAEILRVEVRREDSGPYLAGLLRVLPMSPAMRFRGPDPRTGEWHGARLDSVSFVRGPLLVPVDDVTDRR